MPRRTLVKRRVIRGNPLRKPSLLKKLNPLSAAIKKHARSENERRRAARQVLLRKRSGEKVSDADAKKAVAALGLKGTSAKQFRANIRKKAVANQEAKQKIAEAIKKRSEKAKANAANQRKPTKKSSKK